jgi:hypothetical protein
VTPKQPKARAGKAGSIDKERVNQLDEKLIAAQIETDLREARRAEAPRIKAQSSGDTQKAAGVLKAQFRAKADPMKPIQLENGAVRYGTPHAAMEILTRTAGMVRVRLVRGSRSLTYDWKSQTKGLDALLEDRPNKPTKSLHGTPSEIRKRLETNGSRIRLDPVVFDLVNWPAVNADNVLDLLDKIVCAPDQKADLLLKGLCAKIKAARRIRGTSAEAPPPSRRFMEKLSELTAKLKHPPTKGELAKQLSLDIAEVSRLCTETGFGWLPRGQAGRPPAKRRQV